MRFSDKLPKLRKENNLSQEQLAERLGVSRQAVSKWEIGASYPDMEKIIQICKILNCHLDDLIDDDATGGKETNKLTKFNIGDWLKELLSFITKTYNMFCNMKLIEKIKCLLEITLLILIIYLAFSLIGSLFSNILSKVFYLLPHRLYKFIINIGEFIYYCLAAVLGSIIAIHLFKVRYLNYFVTIEDIKVNDQTVEEPIEENKTTINNKKQFFERRKEKIIIRDPKHTTFSLVSYLAKLIIFCLKLFVIFFSFPIIIFFIIGVFGFTIGLWLVKDGLIFLGATIAILGILIIIYLIIEQFYKFILNKEYHLKRIFIMFIGSLIAVGVGSGILFCSYLSFKPVTDGFNKTTTIVLPMQDNLAISYNLDNTDIEITDDKDNIEIFIKHFDYMNIHKSYYSTEEYQVYYFNINLSDYNYLHIFKQIIADFKNKQSRNYDYDSFNYDIYKIKISAKNLEKLKNNMTAAKVEFSYYYNQ